MGGVADEWVVREPHPALKQLVTRYIGYRQHDVTLEVHRGLPSRHVTLVISLEEPVRIAHAPRYEQAKQADGAELATHGLIGGMHTAPLLITQDSTQAGLHLELNPLGARALLGMPAAELSGEVLALGDLGVTPLAELPERLRAVPDWARRFDILDATLCRVVGQKPAPTSEVGLAWSRLLSAAGRMRMADLSGETGWSRRHLRARFKAELGLSPKQAARVLRFEHACVRLRAGTAPDLATLASECGYFDQAHLSNEWRALAGCSPGTWITEELPFLQYDEAESPQNWLA